MWVDVWSQTTIEPDTPSEYITVRSEFGDDEDQDKPGSRLGDTQFDNLEPLGTKDDFQVTDSDYVHVRSFLSPSYSTSAYTNSGISGQSMKYYNKEPSLLNLSSGE